jgi:hypothetical protein
MHAPTFQLLKDEPREMGKRKASACEWQTENWFSEAGVPELSARSGINSPEM